MSTSEQSTESAFWDSLHEQARFRPAYPNEHVVRFLARHRRTAGSRRSRALDIGAGAGRHTLLLWRFGYAADGVDISKEALRHARGLIDQAGASANLHQAPMTRLPFGEETFEVALAVHVLYYGTASQAREAISEIHRVLKPHGNAFVIARSTRDFRFGRGEALGENTYRLETDVTNEATTVQHFLPEEAVPAAFAQFSALDFERSETTFDQRRSRNSDWLISVRK